MAPYKRHRTRDTVHATMAATLFDLLNRLNPAKDWSNRPSAQDTCGTRLTHSTF